MDSGTLKLVIFSFVISLLFPVFAYTFTSFGASPQDFDISLSYDALTDAGIVLADGESHNITFKSAWTEYTVQNISMRIKWVDSASNGDYFGHYIQNWIGALTGLWSLPRILNPYFGDVSSGVLSPYGVNNLTVVTNWNPQYNWTRYKIKENALEVFITPLASDNNNISKAIYETGTVTVTVGTQVFETGGMNFIKFTQWYIGVVTGQGQGWGLPSFMNWIVRIFSFLTLLSAYLLATELIP